MPVPDGGRAGGGRVPTPTHGAFSPLSGAGNHSYCRNPDQDPRGPWCYVSGEAGAPEKRPCQDLRCPGTQTPRPGLPRSCRNTRRARAAARHRPAPPRPAPSDWPGLSPGRGTRSSLAGAAARNELILRKLLVNNCGRLGPAPRPSSAPGTPLGEPRRSVLLVHALSSPLGVYGPVCVVSAVC